MNDPQRQLIRHAVAALAYRAGKALRGAPASFAEFQTGPNPKTPVRILAHMGDLLNWALAMSAGSQGVAGFDAAGLGRGDHEGTLWLFCHF